MNAAEHIASFYADVLVQFDFAGQLAQIQEQLQAFAARLGAIVVPVKIEGIDQTKLNFAGMAASNEAIAAPLRKSGLTESQWDTTKSMRAQGYEQGDGGWKPPVASSGFGLLGGMGGMLGFGASLAVFGGAMATVGDLVKGAGLDRQMAILHAIIPNQTQYNQILPQIVTTANLSGTNIDDTMHGFVAFANAAKNANIDMGTAAESFKSLSLAISATGSQYQAYRIYGDFIHMILNTSKVSMAQIQRTDLGRYLDIPKLLENLPQFKGITDPKKLADAFNQLSKAEQLNLINTALLTAYQAQAAAGMDTVAGRWTEFTNSLEILGGVIVTILTPALRVILDLLTLFADSLIYLGEKLSTITHFMNMSAQDNNKTIEAALTHHSFSLRDTAKAAFSVTNSVTQPGPLGIVQAIKDGISDMHLSVIVQNKSKSTVNASATLNAPNNSTAMRRSY